MRGYTLAEVLIAVVISVVVGALLLTIIIQSSGLYTKQSTTLKSGLNINDSLSQIRNSIKLASSVDATSDDQTLVLKVPSVDSSGNIINQTFDTFTFSRDNTKLIFQTSPDPASSRGVENRIFTTSLESITFLYYDLANPPNQVNPEEAGRVQVNLALKQRVGIDFEVQTATSEATLRNL